MNFNIKKNQKRRWAVTDKGISFPIMKYIAGLQSKCDLELHNKRKKRSERARMMKNFRGKHTHGVTWH